MSIDVLCSGIRQAKNGSEPLPVPTTVVRTASSWSTTSRIGCVLLKVTSRTFSFTFPACTRVQESFEHVREWLKEVDRYAAPETCKLLIGNKSDRTDKVVSEAEGQALANELKMPFLETSARTAENVEAAFIRMADQLIKLR